MPPLNAATVVLVAVMLIGLGVRGHVEVRWRWWPVPVLAGLLLLGVFL